MSTVLKCACGEKFDGDRQYARHSNDCPALQERIRAAATKRKAQEQAKREEKRRRKEIETAGLEAEEWHGLGLGGNEENDMAAVEPIPSPPRQPSPHPPAAFVSRAGRVRRPPGWIANLQPTSLAGLPAHIRPPTPPPPPPAPPPTNPEDRSHANEPNAEPAAPVFTICTEPNVFGVYREYTRAPQHDPEERKTLKDLLDPVAFPDAVPSTRGRVPSAFRRVHSGHSEIPPMQESSTSPPYPSFLPSNISDEQLYAPMRNVSEFKLLQWQYNHPNSSSNQAVNALVRDVFHAEGFSVSHFPSGFTIEGAQARLESWDAGGDLASLFPVKNGWRNARVLIRVPKEGVKFTSEETAPQYPVEDVLIRDLLDVFIDMYESPAASDFHWIPHKMMCRLRSHFPVTHPSHGQEAAGPSADRPAEEGRYARRVYTEFYNSDEMLDADADLQARPRHPDDPPDLEYAVGPILLWSDSTHLANFGTASLWPVYAYTGLQSKYTRGRPTSFSAQHIAYIPSLPDDFTDWFMKTFDGTAPRSELLTFCRRELYQAVILLLLDERFMEAYRHGVLILCGDDIRRRMFPRFLIHSADYVEKILAACLRYFAKCPCPRCYIDKEKIPEMGIRNDLHRRNKVREDNAHIQARIKLARKWLFEDGVPLTSVWLKRTLEPMSLTPTRNAFSTKLHAEFGFNFYSMYVPDLMHEFELGVWKSALMHLVRLLHAFGDDKIQKFNERYRMIPTFGRNTIRRFVNNMADLKKLAARDYEDSLQCSMSVFDGLPDSDEDNRIILDMLFDFGCWHALAKLRLHTDDTLDLLDAVTVQLGQSTRKFSRTTCKKYETYELPRESAARGRRRAALANKGKGKGRAGQASTGATRKRKSYSLKTYKYHSLWDYAAHIRRYGPSDNWTTQIGELEHRHVKRFYARTNKHHHARQIARHVNLEAKIRKKAALVERELQRKRESVTPLATAGPRVNPFARPPSSNTRAAREHAPEEAVDPRQQYHIAESEREYDDISGWVAKHRGDPAFDNFLPRLSDHIIARLNGDTFQGEEPECSVADRSALRFVANRIYHHHRMRLNYTTYDMRRSQDVIDPASHPDIMTFSHEDGDGNDSGDAHPYWYSRVIHIFHVNVYRTDAVPGTAASRPQRMDILWVRWFGLDPTTPHGFKAKRHPRIGFVPYEDGSIPFGFLDPTVVIRGSHIMPVPSFNHTPELLPPSVARHGQNVYEKPEYHEQDYQYYMVNMFVDRDMLMRYLGGGVGHADTGPDIQIAFDDEDFTWEDVDPEAADLFEPSDNELEDTQQRAGPSSSGASAGAAANAAQDGITPEQRVLQLVQGLDGLAETEDRDLDDPRAASVNINGQEDEEDDEDGPEDDEEEVEDEDLGSEPENEGDEDADGEDEDEYGQEGYAAD